MIGRISKTLIRLRDLFRFRKFPGVQIHPSAVIDVPCEIGSGTRIWHFAHLYEGCSVGVDCMIGQNVMIGPNVSVGKGCKVQNNVSLYEGVTLGDGVFCGPGCVFTNVINPRAEIDRKHEFKPTLVRSGATLGANSTIVCGTTIGKFAFIGAAAAWAKCKPEGVAIDTACTSWSLNTSSMLW